MLNWIQTPAMGASCLWHKKPMSNIFKYYFMFIVKCMLPRMVNMMNPNEVHLNIFSLFKSHSKTGRGLWGSTGKCYEILLSWTLFMLHKTSTSFSLIVYLYESRVFQKSCIYFFHLFIFSSTIFDFELDRTAHFKCYFMWKMLEVIYKGKIFLHHKKLAFQEGRVDMCMQPYISKTYMLQCIWKSMPSSSDMFMHVKKCRSINSIFVRTGAMRKQFNAVFFFYNYLPTTELQPYWAVF